MSQSSHLQKKSLPTALNDSKVLFNSQDITWTFGHRLLGLINPGIIIQIRSVSSASEFHSSKYYFTAIFYKKLIHLQTYKVPSKHVYSSRHLRRLIRRKRISRIMSAVPQGAFAAVKVRQVLENSNRKKFNEENEKTEFMRFSPAETGREHPPEYSSKLMNSIWGLYNKYSVHSFKKNNDPADFAVFNNKYVRVFIESFN